MILIKSLTVISQSRTMRYVVGEEVNGRVIIEIQSVGCEYEDRMHSEYYVLDEDGELIATIENCPVVVEYIWIAPDDKLII